MFMYGHTTPGGYAEKVLCDVRSLVRVPAGVSLSHASFLNCTAAVALRALRTHARLRAGERVLVTGASGGVGVHGLQVARCLGAETVAVTSSPEKAERLAPFADRVIVSTPGEFHREAKGLDIDVVLDCVGAPTLNASLRSLRPGGRLLIVGNVDQERFALNPGYVILYEIAVMGSAVSSRRDLEDVLAWAAEGKLFPQQQTALPLEKAAEAQAMLAARGAQGRVVLVPNASEEAR
jgi:D-arabinose 1-dehydrogenase-like Zn-dependent alcohol dehydrogenase